MSSHTRQIAVIPIRYDGLAADDHRLDMAEMAEALVGWNRILVVCGNFAANQKIVLRLTTADVQAFAQAPEAGCVTFSGVIEWIDASPFLATVAGGLTLALITWVFKSASGQKEEMRHLRAITEAALKQAGTRDEKVMTRLMDTVDRMVESLRPSARQAVKPIGQSAGTMTIGEASVEAFEVDQADAEAIRSEVPQQVGPEAVFTVGITELDLQKGSCKISIDGIDGRISGKVTDPALSLPNNPYSLAFAAMTPLAVRAKPTYRNGILLKLFISNTA